jgi:hypothetical protein
MQVKGIFVIMEKIGVLLLNMFEGRVISICMRASFVKARIYFQTTVRSRITIRFQLECEF